MNLADAIRQAALGQRKLQKQPPPPPTDEEEESTSTHIEAANPSPVLQMSSGTNSDHEPEDGEPDDDLGIDPAMLSAAAAAAAAAAATFDPASSYPDPIMAGSLGQNAIRLELFLTPEQMNLMLRAVMTSHHSVMTLREAAAYLRMPASTLERMAQEHEVPAFVIDGRWRFPKPALDEWLAIRALKGERDVA